MSVSQPSLGSALQSAHPGAHDPGPSTQTSLAEHDTPAVTFGNLVQSRPQAPQL